jgi:hypothetical protein
MGSAYDPKNPFSGLFGTSPGDWLDELAKRSSPQNPFGSLLSSGLPIGNSLSGALTSTAVVKRKAFFSFHFDDVMRVNVVRNAWKITHPDNALMRSFYDSSLWDAKKLEGDDAVKRVIREGVSYTSAVCVLVGSETWLRRWVKYEIARAIIDERGLLAVHLNSIRHHKTLTPHTRGPNPLEFMAVGKVQDGALSPARHYLFERIATPGPSGYQWAWQRYQDYTDAVKLPKWLAEPAPAYVTPLSNNANTYDYIADNGHRNIGAWRDLAAQRAGR